MLERFNKKCSRLLVENVFGETPNTAGEDAHAPQNEGTLVATGFVETLWRGVSEVMLRNPSAGRPRSPELSNFIGSSFH
jgi:hypothetical protein